MIIKLSNLRNQLFIAKEMEKSFEIRTYGFNELAQLYFPNVSKSSATKMFGQWIQNNLKLKTSLEENNWRKRSRNLTPKHVKIIIDHFDPP